MNLNNFRIGQRLGFLAALLLLAILLVGLRGISLNADGLKKNNDIMATETRVAESIDTARNAQVQFKIQVQEWKNILLRGGQGEEAFNKYKAAFLTQSQKTQALLTRLMALQSSIDMDTATVRQTLQLHAQLEQQYLSALQSYSFQDAASAQRVDHLVGGIDREPTRMIDEVVNRTLTHTSRLNQELTAQNLAQYQQTRLTLWLAMGAVLLTGIVITVWLIRSITHPLAKRLISPAPLRPAIYRPISVLRVVMKRRN